jgi:hypothetical protein
MANEQKMSFGSATTVISLTSTLGNGNVAGGTTELDNSSTLYPYALAVLDVPDTFGAAPTNYSSVDLLMVRNAVDGANNDTSSPSGTDIEGAELAGIFVIYDTDEQQRNSQVISLLGVKKANFYIRNNSGQSLIYSSNPITVKITPFTLGT